MIINGTIFKKEIDKRRSDGIHFTTDSLALWSFLCISCGPFIGFWMILSYIDGTCYFADFLLFISFASQPLFMGFYQLSRLYYCFAQSQVYSTKGYSNYVFIIMFLIGIFLIINIIILYSMQYGFIISCGMNNKYQYVYVTTVTKSRSLTDIEFVVWALSNMAMYLFWDITTLLLYIAKIRLFKSMKLTKQTEKSMVIYKRVLSILYRIAILSVFYQIFMFISTVVLVCSSAFLGGGLSTIGLPTSLAYGYSMYLMMDHNTMEYVKFLQRIRGCCCCRCRGIIEEQLSVYDDDERAKNGIERRTTFKSEYETHDISKDHAKIQQTGRDISVETVNM